MTTMATAALGTRGASIARASRLCQSTPGLKQTAIIRQIHISPLPLAIKKPVHVDGRVGTVLPYRHHLVVCNSKSSDWPSKVEGMSEPIMRLARGGIRLPGRAMVTLSDFAPLKGGGCCSEPKDRGCGAGGLDRIDVAVFPEGLVARQLDSSGVDRLLEWLAHGVLPTSWSAGSSSSSLPAPGFAHRWLDLARNRHIFVCTHGSRDYKCGVLGSELLADLRAQISERGLAKHVAAWETSHIGGHKYAANAIVYPRGDWYGTWCDKCGGPLPEDTRHSVKDAKALLDAVTNDAVWWDSWRGAVNLSKQGQIDAWIANSGDSAPADSEADATSWTPAVRRRSA